jgi:hypothetical protein
VPEDLSGVKARPVRKADNLSATCEPPLPVTGIALFLLLLLSVVAAVVVW